MNSIQRRFFLFVAVLLCACLPALAVVLQAPGGSVYQLPSNLTSYDAVMPADNNSTAITSAGTFRSNLGSFTIVIVPNASLSGNAAALAAFERAAAQWEARISDPITVTINAGLADSSAFNNNPNIIGATDSVLLNTGYTNIRNALIADAQVDDSIVNSLPTTLAATLPSGITLHPSIDATKANFKALGFTGLDGMFGVSDGTITFNSDFSFDYDNSVAGGGVTAGHMDFETVAAHEIGHLLGFISSVDIVDYAVDNNLTGALAPNPLDLFRFADTNNPATDPNNAATFSTATRNLVPGGVAITDFGTDTWGIGTEFKMSTGLTQGDGRQASHWKDDALTGQPYIGTMDPTLSYGQIEYITEADFRALDLIGWDIAPLPEPSTYALGLTGLAALCWVRRKRFA